MGDKIAASLLFVNATLDFGIAGGYAYDGRWPLCIVFFAYGVSAVALAWA
jgi:hypothetical protein